MKPVSHKGLHTEWIQDAEYSTAWKEEERKEKLRGLLAEWRKQENLTKAQVAMLTHAVLKNLLLPFTDWRDNYE